jgi:hypothetical protein
VFCNSAAASVYYLMAPPSTQLPQPLSPLPTAAAQGGVMLTQENCGYSGKALMTATQFGLLQVPAGCHYITLYNSRDQLMAIARTGPDYILDVTRPLKALYSMVRLELTPSTILPSFMMPDTSCPIDDHQHLIGDDYAMCEEAISCIANSSSILTTPASAQALDTPAPSSSIPAGSAPPSANLDAPAILPAAQGTAPRDTALPAATKAVASAATSELLDSGKQIDPVIVMKPWGTRQFPGIDPEVLAVLQNRQYLGSSSDLVVQPVQIECYMDPTLAVAVELPVGCLVGGDCYGHGLQGRQSCNQVQSSCVKVDGAGCQDVEHAHYYEKLTLESGSHGLVNMPLSFFRGAGLASAACQPCWHAWL